MNIPTSTENTVINLNINAVKTHAEKRNVFERRRHVEEEVFTPLPTFLLTWRAAGHHQRLPDTPAARDDDGDDRPLTSSPPPLARTEPRATNFQ